MHAVPILAFSLPLWAIGLSVAVFVAISLLMIGVILLQRPQGGGLAAAFGGAQGAGQTAFGTKTGDALTLFTCVVFAVWVATAVFLSFALQPDTAVKAATPATAPAETPPAAPADDTKTTPPATATKPAPAPQLPQPSSAPASNPATGSPVPPSTTPPATNPGATPPVAPPAEAPKLPEQPK